jgi:asparagine N-glycosylation enzyme membrane subunit Stt3
MPYKLFEVVEGAILEVEVEPGAHVAASAEVVTGEGRRFTYRARASADATGVARIRVPYPTRAPGPARAQGPYRVLGGGEAGCASVSEEDVRRGTVVRVAPGGPCEAPGGASEPPPRAPQRGDPGARPGA